MVVFDTVDVLGLGVISDDVSMVFVVIPPFPPEQVERELVLIKI